MGDAKRKREDFLTKHPLCCFCGGSVPSETLDHIPPRVLFTRKEWPEGFVFPACKNCNSRTSQIEQVIALYAHLGSEDESAESGAVFTKLIAGVRNNNSEFLPDPHTSAIEKRKFLQRTGMSLSNGSTIDDLLLARLPTNLSERLAPFWVKLYCALYYREVGAIFPATGTIATVFTTPEYADNEVFDSLFALVTGQRSTSRGRRDLSAEFSYRYQAGEGGRVFASLIHLRGRLLIFSGGVTDRNFTIDTGKPKWRDIFGVPLASNNKS